VPKTILETFSLTKTYRIHESSVEVLKGIDITLTRGVSVAIVGPSGVGKSTLLYLLGLLEQPSSGSLHFDGLDVGRIPDRTRSRIRLAQIGFVFQFHHLLPEFTALENVMLPGLMLGKSQEVSEARSVEILKLVGLAERLHHKPGELSGGEQQRVAFARALINSPELILADEPMGNLDRKASNALEELMWKLCSDQETALLIVTHNINLAEKADRILQLVDGRLSSLQ